MSSSSREDYLKVIFSANQDQRRITNREIATTLEISPASVSEMLQKLTEAKEIIRDPHLGYRLTEKAESATMDLLNKHRLWEVFLATKLGYHWDDVHGEAELLEHATSETLMNRLNDFLGHPEADPHGAPIFLNIANDPNIMAISQVPINTRCIIRRISDASDLLHYISRLDLHLGDELIVIQKEPFDGSMTLQLAGRTIILSGKATSSIYVEPRNT